MTRSTILFVLCLVGAAACLFVNLSSFPLYLFCDEALHILEARSLLADGTDTHKRPWPVLFEAFGAYELGLSVYLQLPFSLLLGSTEESLRIKTGVVCLALTAGIALILRRAPGFSSWWPVPLLFFSSSLLFLHARTGFQAPIAILLYGIFVTSYLVWRSGGGGRRLLSVSLCAAALTLYTYTAGRGWVLIAALGFLILDRKLLLERRREVTPALFVSCLVALPFLAFFIMHTGDIFIRFEQLRAAPPQGQEAPLYIRLFDNISHILSPAFWFGESLQLSFSGAERHRIPGLPYIPLILFPLVIIGFVRVARKKSFIRLPHLLVLSGAGLIPAVFLEVNPLRCFTVWFGLMLLACVGFDHLSTVPCRRWSRLNSAFSLALTISIGITMAYQARWAHANALQHITDFGFNGIQYGSKELSAWLLKQEPMPKTVAFLPRTFNQAAATLRPFLLGVPIVMRVVPPEELCAPAFEENTSRFDEMVLVARTPINELPACGLTYTKRFTVMTPTGLETLYVFSVRRAAGS